MRNYLATLSLMFLALTILLGGSSSQGVLGNLILQLLAVVLIGGVYLVGQQEDGAAEKGPQLCWVVGAVALLVSVQFIPLPPLLWSRLPGREEIATGFDLLNMSLPWQTLSMSPWSSLSSLTWCLPAVATFLIFRSPRGPSFSAAALTIAALAGISVTLGIEQIVSGRLYAYETTNYGMPVGFFSNVNHQAAFIICALVFWAGYNRIGDTMSSTRGRPVRQIIFYGVALYFIVGLILCGSLAGLGLLIIATAGIWLLSAPKRSVRAGAVTALVVLGFAGAIAYGSGGPNSAGFLIDTPQPGMSRWDFWDNGVKMLVHYFPFGSGLGTFEQVYHRFENPAIVDRIFVNHAHNDYLELLIETGLFGLFVICAFFAWVGGRVVLLHRRSASFAAGACGLVVIVIALHSLVDYPLRTAALSSIFAVALGFLARHQVVDGSFKSGRRCVSSRPRSSGV